MKTNEEWWCMDASHREEWVKRTTERAWALAEFGDSDTKVVAENEFTFKVVARSEVPPLRLNFENPFANTTISRSEIMRRYYAAHAEGKAMAEQDDDDQPETNRFIVKRLRREEIARKTGKSTWGSPHKGENGKWRRRTDRHKNKSRTRIVDVITEEAA